MNLDYLSVRQELLIAFGVLFIIYIVKRFIKYEHRKKYPPGPWALPLLGNFPMFFQFPHIKLYGMRNKYGDLVSIKVGPLKAVALNSAKVIREAFSKPEVLGRPEDFTSNFVPVKMPLFSNGKLWLEHRRLLLRAFRDLGMGKTRMHELIMEEIQYVLKVIDEGEGTSCDIRGILTPSMSNNICSLLFGERYDYDDPERIFIDTKMDESNKCAWLASIPALLPFLRKIPFMNRIFKVDAFLKSIDELGKFILNKIEDRKRTLDEHHLRDFIDIYLSEMKIRKTRDTETTLSEDCLPGTVMNLFSAGADTVRASLEWALYTMAAYQDVQAKVHEEINKIIGSEKRPSVDDMKNLPLVQSVLTEILRWKPVAPIGPMRKTLNDVEILGYMIPKDTVIVANFWAALNDESHWKNPERFDPERFLTQEGKFLLKDENYLAFSSGKRSCPGEGLALTEIFLYFVSILQKFSIKLPENEEANFTGELTLLFQPVRHNLVFTSRQ